MLLLKQITMLPQGCCSKQIACLARLPLLKAARATLLTLAENCALKGIILIRIIVAIRLLLKADCKAFHKAPAQSRLPGFPEGFCSKQIARIAMRLLLKAEFYYSKEIAQLDILLL